MKKKHLVQPNFDSRVAGRGVTLSEDFILNSRGEDFRTPGVRKGK